MRESLWSLLELLPALDLVPFFPRFTLRTPQQKQGYGEAFACFFPERLGSRSRLIHFLLISFHHSPHQRQPLRLRTWSGAAAGTATSAE